VEVRDTGAAEHGTLDGPAVRHPLYVALELAVVEVAGQANSSSSCGPTQATDSASEMP
jgi:hypothetical protein